MAGRPRTKYRKVKEIRDQLESLETQLLRLLPKQYHTDGVSRYLDYTLCDEDRDRPFGDKGVAWRAAVRGLRSATSYVVWLEVLIDPDPPSDPLDDGEETNELVDQSVDQRKIEPQDAGLAIDDADESRTVTDNLK